MRSGGLGIGTSSLSMLKPARPVYLVAAVMVAIIPAASGRHQWSLGQLLMLQRSFHQAPTDELCGDWPRAQPGHESRAAAGATVRLRRRLAEEAAIQAGWNWLRGNMAEGKDVAASEVVRVVRALCPGADLASIHEGIRRRLMDFASNAGGSRSL